MKIVAILSGNARQTSYDARAGKLDFLGEVDSFNSVTYAGKLRNGRPFKIFTCVHDRDDEVLKGYEFHALHTHLKPNHHCIEIAKTRVR